MRVPYSSPVAAAVLALAVVGCGSSKSTPPSVKIAWMASNSSEWFDLSRTGARLAAQDLSAASGRDVTVSILDPDMSTVDAQSAKVQEAMDMGVDAINMAVVDPVGMTPSIDTAVAAGIPVLTFSSDAPDSDRVSFYAMDNQAAGVACGQAALTLLGETTPTQVGIVATGDDNGQPSTQPSHVDRLNGFLGELGKHPNFEVATTVLCDNTVEQQPLGCAGVVEQAQVAYPDISLWYIGRGPILALSTLPTDAPTWSAGVLAGTIKVVGFEASQDALPQIKAGYAQFVIGRKFFGWGYDLVTLTFDMLTADRQLDPFYDSGYYSVCANNVDELITNWQAQDFRTPLDSCVLK